MDQKRSKRSTGTSQKKDASRRKDRSSSKKHGLDDKDNLSTAISANKPYNRETELIQEESSYLETSVE